jgi:molecular chaperone GrpE (heat shock protein)
MKDELKKKDEQKLADMQDEIKRAVGKEEAEEAEDSPAEGGAEAEVPEEPKEEVTLAKEELEKLQAAVQEKEERVLRLQADFENFRRRTAKEKEELSAVVTQGILKDMLPLLDNFERAMAAEAKDIDSAEKIMDAYKKRIEAQKKAFENYQPKELDKLNDPLLTSAKQYVFVCISDERSKAMEIVSELI